MKQEIVLNKKNINIGEGKSENDLKNIDDLSEVLVREYLMKNISSENTSLKMFMTDLEKRIIDFTLSLTNGNQKNASRILGVKETSLCEKIKKYKLKKGKKRILLNLEMLNMGEDDISQDLFA